MRARAVVVAAVLAVACEGAATGPDTLAVSGVWTYVGTQEIPSAASLDGSVALQGVGDGSGAFEGTFAVDERSATGSIRRVTGTLGGVLLADSIADFDLLFDGAGRRHFGVLRGDSISGAWTAQGAAAAGSGTFVLRRQGGAP